MAKKDQKEEYLRKILEVQNAHQKIMDQIALESLKEEEGLVHKLLEEENSEQPTLGQRLSDKIASFGGSWIFILCFIIFLFIWMLINNLLAAKAFDPFPYILLNLILSCVAALQAPIILMSQNRKEARESKRAQNDYLINLKTELENRAMDHKLDLLINKQFKELIEIQKIQYDKLDRIEKFIKKK